MKWMKSLRDRIPELTIGALWASLYIGTVLLMVQTP